MGPKKGKKGALTPIPGEEKVGEKVGELDKEKYQIQIRTLGINRQGEISDTDQNPGYK